MEQKLKEFEIVQLQARRKGISISIKKLKSDLESKIEEKRNSLESAESDRRFVASRTDSHIYDKSTTKAEAELKLCESLYEHQVALLVTEMETITKQLSRAKAEFVELFGKDSLVDVEKAIEVLGKNKASENLESEKRAKSESKAIKQLVLSLTSARYSRLIRVSDDLLSRKERTSLNHASRKLESLLSDIMRKTSKTKEASASLASRTKVESIASCLDGIESAISTLEGQTISDKGTRTLVAAITTSYRKLEEAGL